MSDQTQYAKLVADIEHLQSILNSGATSASADGVSATYDLNAVRKRLQELIRRKNNITKRSFMLGIDVSGGSS